jgi:WD40 repeat protein
MIRRTPLGHEAYLAEVEAKDASLVDAHLAETVMAEAFDFPASVALSGDGALLATGTSTGQVRLWRVADRTLLWTEQGTPGVVWGVALSANGRLLASSGADGTLRLFDTVSGRPLASLQGNSGGVWGVALSANGQLNGQWWRRWHGLAVGYRYRAATCEITGSHRSGLRNGVVRQRPTPGQQW